jgi:hypothetical protein
MPTAITDRVGSDDQTYMLRRTRMMSSPEAIVQSDVQSPCWVDWNGHAQVPNHSAQKLHHWRADSTRYITDKISQIYKETLYSNQNITHTTITRPHPKRLVSAPSNTCTSRTTSSTTKSGTRAQSATRVSSTNHAARVSATDHTSTSRHWWLSLTTTATAHES